jgi:chromosome segregation ATPase
LQLLEANHAKELEHMIATEQKGYEEQMEVLLTEHADNIKALESELTEAREDLMKVATQVAFGLGLDVSVDKLTERIDDLIADQKALAEEQKKSSEAEKHVAEIVSINDTVMKDLEVVKKTLSELLAADGDQLKSPLPTVPEQMAILKKRMLDLETRNKNNSRLLEELEDQLQTNFDQAQLTTNRLSTLQTERNVQLEEANASKAKIQTELDSIREEYSALQVRFSMSFRRHPINVANNARADQVRGAPAWRKPGAAIQLVEL